MLGGQIILDALVKNQNGHVTIFGLCGSTTYKFNLIMQEGENAGKVDYVHCTNEIGATLAAANFSDDKGKVGVAITTRGVGVAMAIVGLGSSDREELPMIYISGVAFGAPEDTFQALDTDIVKYVTKKTIKITDDMNTKAQIEDAIDEAFFVARHGSDDNPGSGPVVLFVSDNMWLMKITEPGISKYDPSHVRTGNEKAALRQIIKRWNKASKIVLRFGPRVEPDALKKMVKLANEFPQLYLTSVYDARGNLSPDVSPKFLDMSGPIGNSVANGAVKEADLVIEAGVGIIYGLLVNETRDDRVINLYDEVITKPGYFVNVSAVLRSLYRHKYKLRPCKFWKVGDPTLAYKKTLDSYMAEDGKMNQLVALTVNEFLEPNSLIATDNICHLTDIGSAGFAAAQLLRVNKKENLGNYSEFSPIGIVLGSAVGKIYSEPRDTVLHVGDGGFLTMLANYVDLNAACITHGTRCLIVFYDDSKYGNVALGEMNVFKQYTVITETNYLFKNLNLQSMFEMGQVVKYWDHYDLDGIKAWHTKEEGYTSPGLYVMIGKAATSALHS